MVRTRRIGAARPASSAPTAAAGVQDQESIKITSILMILLLLLVTTKEKNK
jgi:hypothetical protein